MTISKCCSFELPAWVELFLESWLIPLSTTSQRMQLAIALSEENVRQQTGGPFAAVVVNEETEELVSVGINLVTSAGLSIAHAEMVALSLAQTTVGEWNLSHAGTVAVGHKLRTLRHVFWRCALVGSEKPDLWCTQKGCRGGWIR